MLLDCPACCVCVGRSALQPHRAPFWEVSCTAVAAVDVRRTVHLLQVVPTYIVSENTTLLRFLSLSFHQAAQPKNFPVTSCDHDFNHLLFNIYSNDARGNPAMEELLEALLDQPGFGTKCMEKEEEDTP